MYAFVEQLIAHSLTFALVIVLMVAFFESLALVGLLLPGTVFMAALGALIGSGNLPFWWAWGVGIIGCLAGDWVSFWIGWRFKRPLRNWSFLKKYKTLVDKTEMALHRHSTVTILIGRFVGPTRPLVPMLAGMLGLSVSRFARANIPGCLFWPPVYFLPGILAGAAIDIPTGENTGHFQWLLLVAAVVTWLALWLNWRLWRSERKPSGEIPEGRLPRARLMWLAPLASVCCLALVFLLVRHPLMPVYARILHQVIFG